MIEYVKRLAGPFTSEGQSRLPFGFLIFEKTDVYVATADDPEAQAKMLVYGQDYSVEMNADQTATPGGTVVLMTPIVKGNIFVVGSAVAYTQNMQLTNYSRFPPEIINEAMDRVVVQIQQLVERLGRTLSVPPTSDSTPEQLIEKLMSAQDDARQFADAAQKSAEEAKKSELKTAEYAEAATVLVPMKAEIKTVADHIVAVDKVAGAVDDGTLEKAANSVGASAENARRAETAKAGADTAKSGAESAKTAAVTAQGKAETAANTATQKATEATTKASEAAKSAQAAAESAKTAAYAMRLTSVNMSASGTAAITSLTPQANIKVGDTVIDPDGEIFSITAIAGSTFTVGAKLTSLKGPQGIRGEKGVQGPKGDTGSKGETGATGPRGPQGAGLEIKDTFDTYEEFIAKHPTGRESDVYFVGNDLYIWSVSSKEWVNKGPIASGGGITGLMDPDPVEYFDAIYGESHGDIIGDLVVNVPPISPDPKDTFENSLL